ncbi:MAG: hypothetical protein GYA42_00575 [Syntrophomonadaceae bacterium]|nr:hypothetical protein [Syntrophomonadaceae bacterium]
MNGLNNRGLVTKILVDNCIVLTPEGTYHRIPLPSRDIRVGAEIWYSRSRLSAIPHKPWLLAASLLLFFLGYPLWNQAMLPQAAAYVSMDMIPSLEVAVDDQMQVIGVRCYNDNATDLVKTLDLKGKGLSDALTALIDQAVAQNYVTAGQDNLMISTVSPAGKDNHSVDADALYQVVEKSIADHGYGGQVKIYGTSPEMRKAADDREISVGKYLIYEQLISSGAQVSIEEINRKSVPELASNYNLDLPHSKTISLQAAGLNREPGEYEGGSSRINDTKFDRNTMLSEDRKANNERPESNVSRSLSNRPTGTSKTNRSLSSIGYQRQGADETGMDEGRNVLEISSSRAARNEERQL